MTTITDRKRQHIDIVENKQVEPLPSSFDKYRLPHVAMPEIDMAEIDFKTKFFDFNISAPILVSSMTGGEVDGRKINENLAIACEKEQIPFGLGSMRIILEKPKSKHTFDVKSLAPTVPMFANLGLVQLNYGYGYDEVMKIIDSVNADGVFLHLNHLQEAVQPEGDTNFKDLFPKLEKIMQKIEKPVVVKETGHGIDYKTAKRLKEIGVEWIDVSGTGGTSWAWIEGYRRLSTGEQMDEKNLGHIFRAEGIPTDECLNSCSKIDELNLIAGGGVRNGIHIAKSIALGAKIGTLAKPFMHAALDSADEVIKLIQKLKLELRLAMFCAGVKDLRELGKINLTT